MTPWPVAHQAPPSIGFSRQEYWSGLPFPSPGNFPNPGIEPGSPALQANALTSEPPGKLVNKLHHAPASRHTKRGRLRAGALSASTAKRSYPTSEVRGSGRECQACRCRNGQRSYPSQRSGEAAVRSYHAAVGSYHVSEARGCREKPPPARGQGRWP